MKLAEHLSVFNRAVRMVFRQDRTYAICIILLALVSAVSPYVPIYFSAELIDALTTGETISVIAGYALLTVGLTFLFQLVKSILQKMKERAEDAVYRAENWQYAEKAMEMSYESIENRDVQLLRNRIQKESQTGYNRYYLHQCMDGFVRYTAQIICSFALSFSLFANPKIPIHMKLGLLLLILATLFVSSITVSQGEKAVGEFNKNNVFMNLVSDRYEAYVGNYTMGMDIRLYGMSDTVSGAMLKLNREYSDKWLAVAKKLIVAPVSMGVLNACIRYVTYLVLIVGALAGGVSVGAIAKYVSCILLLVDAVTKWARMIQVAGTNNHYQKRYFSYFDIPNNMYQGTLTVEKREDNEYNVEFRNVSFKYPNTEAYALRNVNLKFRIGEKLAIVGMNGSGKTTFIKLLCRLYDPTEGEILLNGVDIRKYDYDEYMSVFSVVFQDFRLFAFTLGQNVAAGITYDRERVEDCLIRAGFGDRLAALAEGTDTYLYKDFDKDGVEISGGEAQKIALARALYKDAPFILLDEPTAALDPVSEYEVYSNFNRISGDKTTVYISHRLASCRFCDKIAVFDRGSIVQTGKHEELLADADGKYHELWHAQAQYYEK